MSVAMDGSRHGAQVVVLVAYLSARWPATSATALWIMAATSVVAVALDRIAVLGTIIRRIHARARPGSSSI
jgi:hypothetical protein